MKKGTLFFNFVSIILLALLLFMQTEQVQQRAVFQKTEIGEEYSCQTANIDRKGYLFLWNNSIEDCAVIRTDIGQSEYKILNAVSLSKIYYQYHYLDKNGKWKYGVSCYNPENKETSSLLEWETNDTKWLSFGGIEDTGKLYYAVWNEDTKQIEEYEADTLAKTIEWKIVRKIDTQGVMTVCGAYYDEDERLNICTLEGNSFQYEQGSTKVKNTITEYCPNQIIEVSKQAKSDFEWLCFVKSFKSIIVWYLIFMVRFWLLIVGIEDRHSLITRMYNIVELVILIVVIFGTGFYMNRMQNQISDMKIQMTKKQLSSVLLAKKDTGTISREELEVEVERGLLIDILEVDTKQMIVKNSVKVPVGVLVDTYYGSELGQAIRQALTNKETTSVKLSYKGIQTEGVILYNWSDIEKTTLLIGIINNEIAEYTLVREQFILIISAVVIFLLVSFIFSFVFRIYQSRWQSFLQTAEAVAVDKMGYTIPNKNSGGMNAMWETLHQMSKNVEKLEYEKQQNNLTYSHFLPQNIERIFGKENLSELTKESLYTISGTMVQISMNSLKNLEGHEYLKVVDKGMELVQKSLKRHNGIFIQNDPDFLKGKYFFKGEIGKAIDFAVEMAISYTQEECLKNNAPMLIVHTGEYYCGMAGTEEQFIPFVYSREDELLGMYEEALRRAKLQVVITESVLNKLSENCYFVRYIGYISNKKTGKSQKLYECLDGYATEKRKLFMATLSQFEKALDLFYSDDFYLARNTFNKVLQVNPKDQIAKWYLFNCEYYLNEAKNTEISYGLYENQMLEQQYQR